MDENLHLYLLYKLTCQV